MNAFTIVTLALNQGRFLERCISSVQNQDGIDVRQIVIDPMSTDETPQIAARCLRDYDLYIREPDEGPANGLNKGLANVDSEYFGYLNADDYLAPGALSEASEVLANADVAVGDATIVNEHGIPVRRHLHTKISPIRLSLRSTQVVQQSTFYRTSLVNQVGGFNEDNNICWDTELLLDLSMVGARFAYRRSNWSSFRLHPDSITGSGRLSKEYAVERIRLAKKAGHPHAGRWLASSLGRLVKFVERPELLLNLDRLNKA